MNRWTRLFLVSVVGLPLAAAGARAGESYSGPIFDAHVHYSERSWAEVPVAGVFSRFRGADVRGAYVSSTPDEGTLKLLDAAPKWLQIVPSFRPYRPGNGGSADWWRAPDVVEYTRARLAEGRHASVGEIHIHDVSLVDDPAVRALVDIAVEKGWFLHPHADAAVVERLFQLHPGARVVWAHAGFSEGAARVSALMDRHQTLWADLSYREGAVAQGGRVTPEWEAAFRRHPDRFMVGSDTWVTERWLDYQGILDENRAWLGSLPRELADAIAWGNAGRLFGLKKPE